MSDYYKRGLHLYESTQINWSKLPSPLSEREWEDGPFAEAVKTANQEWKHVFDKALEYGFVKMEQGGSSERYVCYWGDLLDADSILLKYDIQLDGNIDADRALNALDELRKRLNDTNRLNNRREIYLKRINIIDNVTSVLDIEFSKQIFIKMVMVREKIALMVRDYEKAMTVIRKIEFML